MASPQRRALVDNEVEAWSAIADNAVAESVLFLLERVVEPEQRAEIVAEYSRSLLAFALQTLKWASAIAAQSWKTADAQDNTLSAKRRQDFELAQRMVEEEKRMMIDLEHRRSVMLSEVSRGDSELQLQSTQLRAAIHDLEGRHAELVGSVGSLQRESDDRRSRLQQQKISIADELREMETQKSTLAIQIEAQRVLFQQQQQKFEEFRRQANEAAPTSTSRATAPQAAEPEAAAPVAAPNGGSSPRSSASRQQDIGIAALQTVREQLRELRESNASSSPLRYAHSTATAGRGLQDSSAGAASHSNLNSSASLTSLDTPSRPLSYTPSSPVSAGGLGSGPVNPWKARLLKLQGDLKTLRADLGAQQ